VGVTSGTGQVGVSIYALDIAGLDGGGDLSSMSQVLSGSMRHPASYHSFHIPVERGKRFDLSASALTQGLSLLIELYGPDGVLKATSETGADGNPYLWNFMPSQTGIYTMVLSNTDDHTGDYQVRVSPSEGAAEAALRARTSFEMSDYKGPGSWFTLEGSAGNGIYLKANPHDNAIDMVVSVYDQYGNRLAQANENGTGAGETIGLVQFPRDGVYQIEIKSHAGAGSGDYYIRPVALVEAGIGGIIYPGGRKESGELSGSAMSIVYLFDGSQGELIGVDAHATSGSGLDLGFDLYTPDGNLLVTRDDDVGKNPVLDRVELPVTGRYVLVIWNYGGTTGTYDVFVTHPQSPSTTPLPE
jgi:hypothetical protein